MVYVYCSKGERVATFLQKALSLLVVAADPLAAVAHSAATEELGGWQEAECTEPYARGVATGFVWTARHPASAASSDPTSAVALVRVAVVVVVLVVEALVVLAVPVLLILLTLLEGLVLLVLSTSSSSSSALLLIMLMW